MNAAILAVGTEITSGQIQNGHATWISAQLEDLGIEVAYHLSVPDDQELILEALDFLEPQVEYLFVTGGLGPTTDDFTRQVIADWLDAELVFDESSWENLQRYLQERRVNISPNHRNQCYFPEGAKILPNPVGSAHGFFIQTEDQSVWVLPGPTPELRGIWKNEIQSKLQQLSPLKEFTVKKWRCLGKPESDLADLTESIVASAHLKTGYRLASPYVEVKVWAPHKMTSTQTEALKKLDQAFAPWLVSRDNEDVAAIFLQTILSRTPLTVIDHCTQGQIVERLMSIVRTQEFKYALTAIASTHSGRNPIAVSTAAQFNHNAESDPRSDNSILILEPTNNDLVWTIKFIDLNKTYSQELRYDHLVKVPSERRHKLMTEASIKAALSWVL